MNMDAHLLAHLAYLKPQDALIPLEFAPQLKEPAFQTERNSANTAELALLTQLGYLNKNSNDTSPPGTTDYHSSDYSSHKDKYADRDRDRKRKPRWEEKHERNNDRYSRDRHRDGRYDKEDRYERDSDGYSSDGYDNRRRDRSRSPRRRRRYENSYNDEDSPLGDRRRRYDSYDDDSYSQSDISRDGRNSDNRKSDQQQPFENLPPNNTIMVRGMASGITENELRVDIITSGMMPKDIRLIRRKDSGASRGFAFVEFNTVQEASRWMELRQVEKSTSFALFNPA